MTPFTIQNIYIYPVKSLGGICVDSAFLENRGFQYDRRWMLVDENKRFLSQREMPKLVLFNLTIKEEGFEIISRLSDNEMFVLPFSIDRGTKLKVTVWEDICSVIEFRKGSEWFSKQLNIVCKLVYMPDSTNRFVDKKYAFNNEIVSFTDAYPVLLIGQQSLDYLNQKLTSPIEMKRFRPNLVISGSEAFSEDSWKLIQINEVEIIIAKPCARCVVPSINPKNGKKEKEPAATLATFRNRDNKIYFGQNCLPKNSGTIKCGDIIKVLK